MLQDWKIYCLQARPCIFHPGNFTGWGSEHTSDIPQNCILSHDYSAVYILAVLCVNRGGHWLCVSEYSITNNKRMNRKMNYSPASELEDEEKETKQIIIMQITSTDDSKP